MKRLLFTLTLCASLLSTGYAAQNLADDVMPTIEQQTDLMLERVENLPMMKIPRTVVNDRVKFVDIPDWTAGFFTGSLWYINQLSKDKSDKWLKEAERYTEFLNSGQFMSRNHDIGFLMMCTYGNGFRFEGHTDYIPEIIQSARTLEKRYRPNVGAIQSWGVIKDASAFKDPNDPNQCPVIIDNMMNLELWFATTAMTGDSTFYHKAVSHADVTMRNHFRKDNSSYHVVNYSLKTGEALHKRTHQGWNDDSAWARGQAWGLYGYTVCYRYTRDERYFDMAKKIAKLLIKEAKKVEDGIFYWDFDYPIESDTPRDASAAAVTASALYELYTYSKSKEYKQTADRILTSLSSPEYLAEVGTNHNFLLKHSTGHFNANIEVDQPLNYADYYYLESLYRQKQLNAGEEIGYVEERLAPSNDRKEWLDAMDKISRPVLENLAAGTLQKNFPLNRPDRGGVTYLEAIGRTMSGIGPWLESNSGDNEECALREEYRGLVIKSIQNIVNPNSSDYIKFDENGQNLVDAAFLVHGMLRCRSAIWDKLSRETQQQFVTSLQKTTKFRGGMNNWLLFSAMVHIGLKEFGGEWDESKVHFAIDNMESWHKGDGVYGDGVDYHADYYNSFVIQPMMVYCVEYMTDNGYKCSADRHMVQMRMRRYAEIQERQISPEGTYPIVGRSICYRFGAFYALSDAAYRHLLPYWVKPSQVRSALTEVINRQISADGTFDRDGWMRMGIYGEQPATGETYITIGSLYLANFVFVALGLPTDDPFWSDPATDWTNLRAVKSRYVELDMSMDKRFDPPKYMGAVKLYSDVF